MGIKPRRWVIDPKAEATAHETERVAHLSKTLGLNPITIQILFQKGIESEEEINRYLFPKLKDLQNPFAIQDMTRAVERMDLAKNQNEKVFIFGDYDVDGTCGAALLVWTLSEFGYEVKADQPDRFKDGYGLNLKAVEKAHEWGAKVLISVDCGITNHEAAEKAKSLGIDLIVIDHHQVDPKRGIPQDALAVIDPQREDCLTGLKQVCGCGLAFYFAMALRAHGREKGWWHETLPNLKQHLDLVVLATAADMVPLTGDNRILVAHGMQVLQNTSKPGFRSMLEQAGLCGKTVSPGHLGFVLGPRINASGRIENASFALRLLTTENAIEGAQLASELERLNEERKNLQNQIWDEVKAHVEKEIEAGKFQNAIVVGSEGWHEGVVGIVASRVTEYFRMPAIVLSIKDSKAKGSARSYGGKNILQALRACSELLASFGGHHFAAGMSLDRSQLSDFQHAFDQAVSELRNPNQDDDPPLILNGAVELDDFSFETLMEIERLGPFGVGNPEPIFQVDAEIRQHRILKGRHLKLSLSSSESQSKFMEAIWFHAAEDEALLEELEKNPKSRWAGVPELNRFRGRVTPTLRIRDRHSF